MTTLYFIRHARPAASFGDFVDPGLDDVGKSQAEAVARELAGRLRPLAVYSSPLQRCRETALPLAGIWGVSPIIAAEVGEFHRRHYRSSSVKPGCATPWPALGPG